LVEDFVDFALISDKDKNILLSNIEEIDINKLYNDSKIKYEYKCNYCGEILYNLPIHLENGSYIDFSANCSKCNGLKPFTLHQIIT
jgi:formylmethanofuran dehydrogenase subunit E